MDLTGKHVLLTGGSLGIGKATAALLIEKGAHVAITGRGRERLEAAAQEIGAFPIVADAGKPEDIERTYKEYFAQFERLDVLVNNAGIGGDFSTVEKLSWEDFEKVFRVNVFGAAMMGSKAAQIFMEQSSGNIVNIGSTASLKGFARGSVYSSSKFALRSLSQTWAAELRKHNVRVFQVNPSEVKTAFAQEDRVERPDEPNKLRSQEIAHAIVGALEMDDRGFIPEFSVWATNPY